MILFTLSVWVAGIVAGWGLRILFGWVMQTSDADPRFGVLMLIGGAGLLVVAIAAVVEGT